MSATWIRAQEFGQPLTFTVIGTSSSGIRSSSSSISCAAFALVSTIASLQNSMPVQAIVFRRPADRRRDADVELAVLLLVYADVITLYGGNLGCRPVDQLPLEVLLLEHLTE